MKHSVLKLAGISLLAIGFAASLGAVGLPEIDATTGVNALALVTGALLIIRSRRR